MEESSLLDVERSETYSDPAEVDQLSENEPLSKKRRFNNCLPQRNTNVTQNNQYDNVSIENLRRKFIVEEHELKMESLRMKIEANAAKKLYYTLLSGSVVSGNTTENKVDDADDEPFNNHACESSE